jgi:hypothetical protein
LSLLGATAIVLRTQKLDVLNLTDAMPSVNGRRSLYPQSEQRAPWTTHHPASIRLALEFAPWTSWTTLPGPRAGKDLQVTRSMRLEHRWFCGVNLWMWGLHPSMWWPFHGGGCEIDVHQVGAVLVAQRHRGAGVTGGDCDYGGDDRDTPGEWAGRQCPLAVCACHGLAQGQLGVDIQVSGVKLHDRERSGGPAECGPVGIGVALRGIGTISGNRGQATGEDDICLGVLDGRSAGSVGASGVEPRGRPGRFPGCQKAGALFRSMLAVFSFYRIE